MFELLFQSMDFRAQSGCLNIRDGSEISAWSWWMWPKPCTSWKGNCISSELGARWHWTLQQAHTPAFLMGSAESFWGKQSLVGSCFILPPWLCWMGEGSFSLNPLSNQFNTVSYDALWPTECPPPSCSCWPCFYSHLQCLILQWSFLHYLSQFHLPGSSTVSLVLKLQSLGFSIMLLS